eukprot:TRINITY_DN7788_c0_g1_i1.p1 TRINITY_DN7788_c0_g1~~TRINITY_DN7788_c0_g1_i1.p1  ORF type:complete len:632 (+),score=130.23 TRINITY_DN7788_c0_g1_i1:157-2052(+)
MKSQTAFFCFLGFGLATFLPVIADVSVSEVDFANAALTEDDLCREGDDACSVSLRQLRLKRQTEENSVADTVDGSEDEAGDSGLSGSAFGAAADSIPCAARGESWNDDEVLALAEEDAEEEVESNSSGDCFHAGTYYLEPGGRHALPGTRRIKVHSAEDCQSACAATTGCGHFSFWADGGCLLTSPRAYARHHKYSTGGPNSCTGAPVRAWSPPSAMIVRKRHGLDPPTTSTQYKGVAVEPLKVSGTGVKHIFAIGDWGGLLGTGAGKMVQYRGGVGRGSHTMARFRGPCRTPDMVSCFNGRRCKKACRYNPAVDRHAQVLVAHQFNKRAASSKPDFILNVGDNFYWGGLNTKCGHPMHSINQITKTQFNEIFENVYRGPGVDGIPWFSVLGNHDWGGFQFDKAWDQQIAYTWASDRWLMPAPYYSRRVDYDDAGFSAEFFMLDTNAMDVKPMHADPNHNICGAKHTPRGADCSATGGPRDLKACFKFMWDLWREQEKWIVKKLDESTADWQVAVTHFQCGHAAQMYRKLHNEHGLDLLVTGHTHTQAIFHNWSHLGGLTCFITGGGGGITSEGDPNSPRSSQYGFYDLAISKEKIDIESVNYKGFTVGRATVLPKSKPEAEKPADADSSS